MAVTLVNASLESRLGGNVLKMNVKGAILTSLPIDNTLQSLQEKDVFLWALPRSDRIVIQLSFFLFILVYLFCMLDSTSCITYVEMLRVCNASIEL